MASRHRSSRSSPCLQAAVNTSYPSSTTSNKRSRIAASSSSLTLTTKKKKKLVLCYMNTLDKNYNVSYSFEFFSIQALLDYKCPVIKPDRTLPWPDNIDLTGYPTSYISFLHSYSSPMKDGDGGSGVVYAVGGCFSARHYPRIDDDPESLPNVLTCIRLSEHGLLDGTKTCMIGGGKRLPLIEEIDGLIYVLSAPAKCYSPRYEVRKNTFEVYNPRENTWKILEDLPLKYVPESPNFYSYSHLVYDHKLFVSDGQYSCVFDTLHKKWKPCHLFSDYYSPCEMPYASTDARKRLDDWGHGFPFESNALPWKEQVFLCIVPNTCDPMAAFRIKDEGGGGEKAVPLKLRYEGPLLPYGRGLQIVDIGSDHFALIVREKLGSGKSFERHETVFTFKLDIDTITQDHLLVKDLNRSYSEPEKNLSTFLHSFAY